VAIAVAGGKLVLVLRILALIAAIAVALPAAADPLPRRAWLGMQATPMPEGRRVDGVLPSSTAEALGIRAGDMVPDGPDMQRWLTPGATPDPDARVSLPVVRDGKPLVLSGKAVARPYESYRGGDVRYGSVAFGGGQLRDILVLPKGVAAPPVVFLIQGVDCGSVDSPNPGSIWRRIGQALIDAGIGYYRVEKPGVGDSRGGDGCQAIDYAQELDVFRTAYRHLSTDLGVPRDRVILFGVSLGGLHAPQLAAEAAPRGVAVWGTIIRNWGDYWHDLDTYQGFLLSGLDPVTEYRKAERYREMLHLFYFEGQAPAAIAAAHPEMGDAMRDTLGWDGAVTMSGRHYRYFQQMPGLDLFSAWSKVQAPVLSLYGDSDVIALSAFDQRFIADLVNHYRPGTAEFRTVPETDHLMRKVGPREALRDAAIARQPLNADFNPAVADALVHWVHAVLAKPAEASG
jgi:pimeloyl-ACP methyl ester carboxylesterase